MELTKQMLDEIAALFRGVEYGKIIFKINPENKALDCTVETSHRLGIEQKPKAYRRKIARKGKGGSPMQ